MANNNSIQAFFRSRDPSQLQETIGITQWNRNDESAWYQIIGGLIIQGGLLAAPGPVLFSAPYEKQLLGVFVNGGTATLSTKTGFTSSAASYWWAIGI